MKRGLCALGLTGLALLGVVSAASADPHPRIRKIEILHDGVFAPDERLDQIPFLPDMTFIFDAANFLHFDTRHSVIRRELLFQEGDPADPEVLAESERNLRDLDFLREARVFTRPAGPGEVDVVVRVQDTWTTEPRLSVSGGGGEHESEFGVVEKNLFGRGKILALRHVSKIDRDADQALYDDRRIWGSRWRFRGDVQDTSDGHVADGLVEYPFFALDTPWAGGVRFVDRREDNRIFAADGRELSEFRRDQQSAEGRIGHRLAGDPESLVRRLGVFYRRIDDDFAERGVGLEPTLVPRDRRESYPGVFFHHEVVRFVQEKHLNLFDRVEDLNIGNIFDLEVGYSAKAFDATENEPILTASNRQGFDFGPGRKVLLFGLVTGRYGDSDLRNAIVELEGVAFNRVNLFLEQTFVTRVKLDLGRHLDPDVQLFLGSDNGLRGYDTREFVGSKRFVFNLEDRIFFVNDLFHLVSLGAVLFVDCGYAWPPGRGVNLRNVASSVGIGLRIGAPRAADEKIWRLDLAIPLSTAGGEHLTPGFSFGSRQAFDPFTGPFDLQTSGGD